MNVDFQKNKGHTDIAREAELSHLNASKLLRETDKNVKTNVKIDDKEEVLCRKTFFLQSAVSRGDRKQVIFLLEKEGAKEVIDRCNRKGKTALFLAVKNTDQGMVEILLDHGATCDLKEDNTLR